MGEIILNRSFALMIFGECAVNIDKYLKSFCKL
jgi:hypothetical protein